MLYDEQKNTRVLAQTMRVLCALLVSWMCIGCASDMSDVEFSANVRLDPLIADNVHRIGIYVLAPTLSDGTYLPCESLECRDIRPHDPEVTILADADVELSSTLADVTLQDISAGEGRIVFVYAFALADQLIGAGCNTVTIVGGQTNHVTVHVYALKTCAQ